MEHEQSTPKDTQDRKLDHINICRDENVEAKSTGHGFEPWKFIPKALSTVSIQDVRCSTQYLNHTFDYPIHITGMTGGVHQAQTINQNLAWLADRYNIPMGVGSQRSALENSTTKESFLVKKQFPNVFLIANYGIYQLCEKDGVDQALRCVDMIDANALAIHVNILQEQIQWEGDKSLKNPFQKIKELVERAPVPIVIKEVGCGIDRKTAQELFDVGVRAIDVGGVGGTSWGYIESLRSDQEVLQQLGHVFRDWGVPTAHSLLDLKKNFPTVEVTATGGIRDGVTVAKAIALGAKSAGIGLPFFKAALRGKEALEIEIQTLITALKITMVCTESQFLSDLTKKIQYGWKIEKPESLT